MPYTPYLLRALPFQRWVRAVWMHYTKSDAIQLRALWQNSFDFHNFICKFALLSGVESRHRKRSACSTIVNRDNSCNGRIEWDACTGYIQGSCPRYSKCEPIPLFSLRQSRARPVRVPTIRIKLIGPHFLFHIFLFLLGPGGTYEKHDIHNGTPISSDRACSFYTERSCIF